MPPILGQSPLGKKLLELWAWGELSAPSLQELSKASVLTYGSGTDDVTEYSRLGAHGHSDKNIHRDLLVHIGDLLPPEPEQVEAPVLMKDFALKSIGKELLSIFLPHDWFACVFKHGLMEEIFGTSDIQGFWSQVSHDDPKLYKNPMTTIKSWRKLFIPFAVHADGGPHQKHHSINITSIKSLLTELPVDVAMLMLGAIPDQCVSTEKRCKADALAFMGDTEEALGEYWVWSFNALFDGRHPQRDPFGKEFPATSYRASVAGQWLDPVHNLRGCVWLSQQDHQHLSKEYGFPSHSSDMPCMRCPANRADMPWNDLSRGATWRKHIYSPEHLLHHPVGKHWLLKVTGVSHYNFVYDPMHCGEIGAAGTAVAQIFFDAVYKEYKGSKARKLNILMEAIQQAYRECEITENKITHLEYQYFCDKDAPHQNFPDIMASAIKARQVRYLVPVAAKLAQDFFKPGDLYSRLRLECLENLNRSYELVDANGLFLGADVKPYQRACRKFLVTYCALSKLCADAHIKQWPVRPKLHYLDHIAEEAKWISPKACWCYGGERMVGNSAALAQSCLSGTAPHKVPGTMCIKYRTGKHLQFKDLLPHA